MLGRPDWFTTRRYTGLGIRPRTWQGWAYILAVLILLIFIRWQPFWDWSQQTRNILTIIWAFIVVLDVIHIMYVLNKKKQGQ